MMNRPEQDAHDISLTDALIAAWLRGERPPADNLPADVLERVFYHGVSALLVARPDVMSALPQTLRDAIRQQALSEAMWDLQHRRILAPLLEDLAREGIRTAVLKGTALACSVYPSPALRPRGDTDLLVDPAHAGKIHAILKFHGFSRAEDSFAGSSVGVARQECWVAERAGTVQTLDLHWGLMNTWSLPHLLPTDETLTSAQPLPGLSPRARGIATEAALYHACIHRAVHVHSPYHVGEHSYYGGDRLIWFYDMHLLAPHLTPEDWARFMDRCRTDETADLCLEALENTVTLFGSTVPSDVLASLAALPKTGRVSLHLLNASAGRQFLADLAHVPGLRGKLGLIRMRLLPPEDFMRARYPALASSPLWVLYLSRIVGWLRKQGQRT
jgi:hypothetical protein